MTNYQITIGYKAVVTVSVKAKNEKDAKEIGLEYFKNNKSFGKKASIEDDTFKVDGTLDMDATWNQL
jgi:hypothetical protein